MRTALVVLTLAACSALIAGPAVAAGGAPAAAPAKVAPTPGEVSITSKSPQAVEAFKKTIEIDPNYADAHYQLGVSLMAKATTADMVVLTTQASGGGG